MYSILFQLDFLEDSRFPSEMQWYKNTRTEFETCSAHAYSMKSSLLKNLFVAVSFDIVAGRHI